MNHPQKLSYAIRFIHGTLCTKFDHILNQIFLTYTTGNNNFNVWINPQELLKALLAVHPWHNDIQYHERNVPLLLLIHIKSHLSITCTENCITKFLKNDYSQLPHRFIILNKEYGFRTPCRIWDFLLYIFRYYFMFQCRKVQPTGGTSSDFTHNGYVTTMLLYNALYYG